MFLSFKFSKSHQIVTKKESYKSSSANVNVLYGQLNYHSHFTCKIIRMNFNISHFYGRCYKVSKKNKKSKMLVVKLFFLVSAVPSGSSHPNQVLNELSGLGIVDHNSN